jgi:uncharacterized protein (TIGR02246 family)
LFIWEQKIKNMKEIAQENFKKWNELLQTRDPQEVAAMYTGDATFLPTVSPEFKRGSEAAGYFEHFLAKNPDGKIIKEEVQELGENIYLHSGMYNFELDGEDGRTTIEARFSYVWQKIDSEWKIIHHHSSVRPS